MKQCLECMKFPCGKPDCNAILPSKCMYWEEAPDTMQNIIQSSCESIWKAGIHDIENDFNTEYGTYTIKTTKDYLELNIYTGGISENEAVIKKLENNLFWMFFWYESKRGGYYTFRIIKRRRRKKS